jgi:two-component system heavy metal sensor histidine kinase CusS
MPEEIVPLVQRLNELLHRLDDAFARQRALTADIAHELRTPVAGILSTAGVALSADRAPAEYREAMEDVREIARRMRSMIENLLTLARLDSQPPHFQFEPVGLHELVELCWSGCQDKAAQRRLAFQSAIPDDLSCASDKSTLAMIFANLLENAVEYANRAGRIWVTAEIADGVVKIDVANTGCRLSQQQIARVFDRFWRADPSRKDANLHVGLGLALVRRLVASLGGAVEARAGNGDFTVSIRLPVKVPHGDVE